MKAELNSGSYQLSIKVKKDITIRVGALGLCRFPQGTYVYTGSAMKNLRQRVERHLRNDKNKSTISPRWHIDYILSNENTEIISYTLYPSKYREECIRNARLLNSKNTEAPVSGFGSSDCRKCKAHLIKIK
ncbi:DUF123 domain-containing protein [Bacteroidota bacterium]